MWEKVGERECEHEQTEGGEAEGQADSTLSTEPNAGLDSRIPRPWPEPKSRVGHLTDWATQAPLHICTFMETATQAPLHIALLWRQPPRRPFTLHSLNLMKQPVVASKFLL